MSTGRGIGPEIPSLIRIELYKLFWLFLPRLFGESVSGIARVENWTFRNNLFDSAELDPLFYPVSWKLRRGKINFSLACFLCSLMSVIYNVFEDCLSRFWDVSDTKCDAKITFRMCENFFYNKTIFHRNIFTARFSNGSANPQKTFEHVKYWFVLFVRSFFRIHISNGTKVSIIRKGQTLLSRIYPDITIHPKEVTLEGTL